MLSRLRNIPWRFLGSLCLGVMALAGVVLLMGLVSKKDQVQVCSDMKVIIEGKETFIDRVDIEHIVQDQYGIVIGKPLNDIPLEKIESSLKALPYVSNAVVHMDMDGIMKVTVQQRAILLRVINRVGQEFYVDMDGRKIPTTLKYVPRVMVATGNIRESYSKPLDEIESKTVNDLVKLVRYITQDDLWSSQIVQLYVNQDHDIELVTRVGDQEIIIGDVENLEDKLRRIEMFYKKILPKVGTEAYVKVNVKYGDQIICERQGDWVLDSLQISVK